MLVCSTEYVEAGGLMSYGPDFPNLFRRADDDFRLFVARA